MVVLKGNYLAVSNRLIIASISAISFSCDWMICSDSFFTSGSCMLACLLTMIAEEWCGIMAFMYCTSPMGVWVRKPVKTKTNTTILAITISILVFLLAYICPIMAIITIAIGATIS